MGKKKYRSKYTESQLEAAFFKHWVSQYPTHIPAREYRFHPTRKFRFDFAWPMEKIAVEVQGMGPGHFSLPGATQDYEKNLEALLLNWRVVYLTSTSISPTNIHVTCRKIARLLGLKAVAVPSSVIGPYVPLSKRKP